MTTPEFSANRDNYCYRHPDRQSFVLCQRCLRTICPECQTQAPVGVICPECLRDQRKAESPAQRKARRSWGRGPMGAVTDGRPVMTYGIMLVTSIVSLIQMIPGVGDAITDQLYFAAMYLYPQFSVAPFEPWRLLTAALVHGGFLHLALNMLALWMIGRSLEPVLGRWRFLTLYVLSALGGSVAVAVIAPGTATVGASGAVFGLMTALFVVGRHLGANVTGILVVLGLNLVIGFLPQIFGGQSIIAWQAHVGGALVGALIGFIYTRTRRPNQRGWQIALLVAVAVVLLAVVAVVPPMLLLAGAVG
ncbi:membrane associated rhomboid family serine protease [Microbacterium resistens]|uniref:Membrane associated rhomboid family serine protease n=1 Tax=Microbacterium resistens TaxID=156977 RepID=A0ABU1SEE0_9MICO|nr:rhomboid family intramembrane serine protease [Microbacterium resistens]MDR6867934.1 membrane associated rhomboid family serine protease [Microbacterium resistens]